MLRNPTQWYFLLDGDFAGVVISVSGKKWRFEVTVRILYSNASKWDKPSNWDKLTNRDIFLKCVINILTYRVERDLSHLLDMASIQRRTRPFQINSNNQIVQMFKSFKSFQSLRYPNFVVTMRSDALIQLQQFFKIFLCFFARPLFMYYSIPYYHDSKSHQVWTSHLLVTFYIWKTLLETLLALSGKKARGSSCQTS